MRPAFLARLALVPALFVGACSAEVDTPVDRVAAAETEACTALSDTAPGVPKAFFAPFDPVERQALCVLDSAKREVVVAHYNIRTQRVLQKLVELRRRGVDVRVAVDQPNSQNEWNTGDDFLESQGVKLVRVKVDARTSIMHLKAAVVDGEVAMTGSFNWNETAALGNDENMIVFRDPAVVAAYRGEILELLGEAPRKPSGGKLTGKIEVRFSPEERLDTVIAKQIDGAKSRVDVAMYTFTQKTVGDALKRAIARGVKVRLVVEAKSAGGSTIDDELERAGALVVRGANRISAYSAMHQKYGVIDDAKVITGASNWTQAGTRTNEEDLVVIDDAELAKRYRANFADLLWVYAKSDTTADDPAALGRDAAAVLFHVIDDKTQWGDAVFVVGSRPELGSWDPRRAVPVETADSFFPSWTGRVRLPAGARVEYKFITIRPSGEVVWERGANRVLTTAASGRATVVSQTWDDTGRSWTPADAPAPGGGTDPGAER